jgi:hypothetical protein
MVGDADLLVVCIGLLALLDTGLSASALTKIAVFGASSFMIRDQTRLFTAVAFATVLTALPMMSLVDMAGLFVVQLAVPYFKGYDSWASVSLISAQLMLFSALGTLFGYDVRQPFIFLAIGASLALWLCHSYAKQQALNSKLSSAQASSKLIKPEVTHLSLPASSSSKHPISSLHMIRILNKLRDLKQHQQTSGRRGGTALHPLVLGSNASEDSEQSKEYETMSDFFDRSIQSEEEFIPEHANTSIDSQTSLTVEEIDEIIHSILNRGTSQSSSRSGSRRSSRRDEDNLSKDFKKRLTQASVETQPISLKVYARHMRPLAKAKEITTVMDLNENLTELLEQVGDWDFNTLELANYTSEPLTETGIYVFSILEFNESFNISKEVTKKFLAGIESRYSDANYYHNSLHAADVMCSVVFLVHKGLQLCYSLLEIDIFALVVAALAHDVGHPGVNNAYLIATTDVLALQYNDQSVLENMHCSTLFKILQRADCNILANITKGDQLTFRKIVIKTILATDLQKHFEMVKTFRARMEETELPSLEDEKFRLNALELCVKCADLGHGAKKVSLHKEWSGLITKEFYAQGDLEAKHGLPVSSLNDRSGVVSTSQIGFLNALVKPLFEIWEDFVRKFSEETESELAVLTCMNNIRENLAFWAEEHDLFIRGTPSFVIDSLPPPMLRRRGK